MPKPGGFHHPIADDATGLVWQHPDGARIYLYETEEAGRATRYRSIYRRGESGGKAAATFARLDRAEVIAWIHGMISAHEAGATTPKPQAPRTLGEAVAAFSGRTHAATGRPLSSATARAYRSQLCGLLDVTGADYPLAALRPAHVTAALNREGSPTTRAQWLRAIRALCAWLVAQKLIADDPTAGMRAYTPTPPPGRYLTPAQVTRLLAHCGPSTWPRIALAASTGLRIGELIAAQWSWVRGSEADGWWIAIPAAIAKSRRRREVPLPRLGLDALARAKARWPQGTAILGEGNASGDVQSAWNRELRRAAKAAEIDPLPSYHDLRRTAGQGWLEAGATLHEVSGLLGHTDVRTTQRWYVEAPTGRLQALAAKAWGGSGE